MERYKYKKKLGGGDQPHKKRRKGVGEALLLAGETMGKDKDDTFVFYWKRRSLQDSHPGGTLQKGDHWSKIPKGTSTVEEEGDLH